MSILNTSLERLPALDRLPAAERGITIADFLVPIRVGERVSSRVRHVALVVAGALFVSLAARLTIFQEGQTIPLLADFQVRLGESPVPITGQTFGVLLVGGALGLRRGAASLLLYLAMGLLLPVYAGDASGLDTFVSSEGGRIALAPTGGYLFGFVIAAALTGKLAEFGWDRRLGGAILAMLAGNLVIYLAGLPWLALSTGGTPEQVLAWGLTPFVVVDLVKLLAAAALFPAAWWIVGRNPGER